MLTPLLVGIVTSLSLIVAIGAQNAFVLQQGIRREHVLVVVLICAATDAMLEFLGVLGIGYLVESQPLVLEIVRWVGVAFLVLYAVYSFRRAMRPSALLAAQLGKSTSLKQTVLTCLAITYLNPHVYLDTVVLMGAIGNAQGDPERWWFVTGGALASFIWFFALGYGARALTRFFANPRAWRVLDTIIGVTMLVIALRLAFTSIG